LTRPAPRSPPFPSTTLFRSRGGRLFARPVRVEYHGGDGPGHRCLRDLGLPDGGDDVGHGGRADRLAREVPEAQGRGELLEPAGLDRKSTRLNSSHVSISYAV